MSARQMRRAWQRETQREARRAERSRRKKLVGAAGAALGATVLFAPAAHAATFTVNSTDDPGDGTCDPTECTLREAVDDANGAAGADTILFDSTLSGTINLTAGDILITNEALDIQGPGPGVITIDAGYDSRIFDLYGFDAPSTPVRISGLKLRAGSSLYGDGDDGGAIRNGYIPEPASLTVENTVITDSEAGGSGGAIWHSEELIDSLSIVDSRIVDNDAADYGGGVFSSGSSVAISGSRINNNVAEQLGGGVFVKYSFGDETTPAIQITDSELSMNRALGLYDEGAEYQEVGMGGGLFIGLLNGELVVDRSTFSYNSVGDADEETSGFGGGIAGLAVQDATITGSTIAANTSTKYGGGLGLFVTDSAGEPVIQNTTISGNEAALAGGGVWLGPEVKYARFQNSTITDNDAKYGPGGGIFSAGDGGSLDDAVTLSSTIVAENNADDADADLFTDSGNFELDFSLIGDVANATYTDNGNNILGGTVADPPIDPLLAPINDNGGPTETHLPLAGSPALDAGISNDLVTDQRGVARIFDLPDVPNVSDATDMGSVEIQGEPPGEQPGARGECKGSQVPLISGTPGEDELVGTPGSDLIRGAGGKDDIDGREADDCLFGEADDDILNGDSGDDLVSGDDGDDIASGVQGSDNVLGGVGADRLKGNAGADTVDGGSENDVVSGGGGQDELAGGTGNDKVRGAEASDSLSGGAGNDKLKGAGGDDTLKGGAGDDRLNCGAGDDVANAGPGDTVAKNCETVK